MDCWKPSITWRTASTFNSSLVYGPGALGAD